MPLIRCQDCGQPVAEMRGQTLILRFRHHGREHLTMVSLAELAALAGKQTLDTTPVLCYSAGGKD